MKTKYEMFPGIGKNTLCMTKQRKAYRAQYYTQHHTEYNGYEKEVRS